MRANLARLQARIHRWWQAGWWARWMPKDHHVTHQRNVYIVPSGAGWMMAVTLLVMLLASINYQLNLGYLLTFLVAGASGASMLQGHANLRGLWFHLSRPKAVFSGEGVRLSLLCRNPTASHRLAIRVQARCKEARASVLEVVAMSQVQVDVALPAMSRGVHDLPVMQFQSEFPLGLFKVWSVWRPAEQVMVWPSPDPDPPAWPHAKENPNTQNSQNPVGADLWDEIRPYRQGDPLKRLVWKKASLPWAGEGQAGNATPPWPVRHPSQRPTGTVCFDYEQARGHDKENRLSCLCAWVLEAHARDVTFGLRLPEAYVPPAQGENHLHACLEAMARC